MSLDRAEQDYQEAQQELHEAQEEQSRLLTALQEIQTKRDQEFAALRAKHQEEEMKFDRKYQEEIGKRQGEINKAQANLRMLSSKVDSRRRDLEQAKQNKQASD